MSLVTSTLQDNIVELATAPISALGHDLANRHPRPGDGVPTGNGHVGNGTTVPSVAAKEGMGDTGRVVAEMAEEIFRNAKV